MPFHVSMFSHLISIRTWTLEEIRCNLQAPIFLSVFYGIRGMTSLPVEGLKTGGALWFPDLTLCDPYLILPAMSALTVFYVTKVTDSPHLPTDVTFGLTRSQNLTIRPATSIKMTVMRENLRTWGEMVALSVAYIRFCTR